MAITRAQQAKQMLQDGGRIGLRFGSEGYQGRDSAAMGDTGDFGSQAANEAQTAAAEQALGSGGGQGRDTDFQQRGMSALDYAGMSPATMAENFRGRDITLPGISGLALNVIRDFIDRSKLKRSARFPGEDEMAKDRIAELIDQQRDESDGSQIILPIIPKQEPIITEDEEEKPIERFLAFRADGGPIGGEFDFESARQMYGLGKLVKKVTRTVKKIAKSPVGKVALLYAGTAGLGALGAKFGTGVSGTGFGIFRPENVLKNLGASKAFLADKFLGNVAYDDVIGTRTGGLLDKIPGGGVTAGIVGASALAGFLTPKQEQQAQELADNTGMDIEKARNSILARARGNIRDDYRMLSARANGGRIGYQEGSKEPVAKKTMPLLDLDGKEMDLRAEGGFVPIGRMEKADDVPARLSKNEFVFTADAVRNAGDGNVDKGAEVMYNMMKNLEAGGDVSKESQGLEGARRMFQTSKRLEEVL